MEETRQHSIVISNKSVKAQRLLNAKALKHEFQPESSQKLRGTNDKAH